MKKTLLFTLLVAVSAIKVSAQSCTTTNATNCQCKDGSSNCDLLPNITMAEEPLYASGNNGVIEYSQTGNGVENGRLRVSVSTPNIGHGSLTVRATNRYICGPDTFTTNPGTCPDGTSPRNMVVQRVYHKNGNVMTYYDRNAGSMTYHPTHGHMHVDDWGIYTLRVRDTAIADPMQWPIIGSGAKLGFCLMDYGTCSYYNGHCEDSAHNVLQNANFPNFALGGGNYNCSPTEQGISSGYTDIYYQYLDGMYITIPPNTCNGDYYIVVKIDPHDYFLEENENDNVIAIPYTLVNQVPMGGGTATITPSVTSSSVCEGTPINLTANSGTSYLWSTGESTQTITVSEPGSYSVSVNSLCGLAVSPPLTISHIPSHTDADSVAVCEGTPVILTANATGTAHWFDASQNGNELFVGDNYSTTLNSSTTLYVESRDTVSGFSGSVGPIDFSIGGGAYYSNDQHQIFDVFSTVILKSIKVFANSAKSRTFELRNSAGTVLNSVTVNLPQGTDTVYLNFTIPPGTDYQLGWASGSAPDLYRNSAGASYPYSINNLISIKGNSANDLARWYCLYDWKVAEPDITCVSNRTPVVATVNPSPSVSLTGLSSQYYNTDTAVALTGTPAGGSFSGTGVSGTSFSPSDAGVGGPYTVTYSFTDTTGCTGSATSQVTVLLDNNIGINNIEGISGVNVFPNPSNGEFELSLKSADSKKINLNITDAAGKKVFAEDNIHVLNAFVKKIVLKGVAVGVYNLTINTGKKQNTYNVIVQ